MVELRSGIAGRLLSLSGFLVFAALAHYITLYSGYRVLEKYLPDWTFLGIVRVGASALAAYLLIRAIRPAPNAKLMRGMPVWLFVTTAVASFALVYLTALFVIHWPTHIENNVREGDILSIMTEVLFVGALVLIINAALNARKITADRLFGLSPFMIICAILGVMFIIVMEEASWGQHWIGWATPDLFEGNIQNETNLHNFYTYRFEMAYYSAAVMAFVLLPYAWPQEPPAMLRGANLFVPPPMFAVALLPICGYTFYTWNYVFFKIWFFAGLFIALDIARRAKDFDTRFAAYAMGGVLLLPQTVFLVRGYDMPWGHELTEVREFGISIAMIAFAALIRYRIVALVPKAQSVASTEGASDGFAG